MKTASKFQKGSGCYSCYSCGRKTRATGQGDNEQVRLCVECYEIAGIENEIADRGDSAGELRLEIETLKATVRSKGGAL